MTAAPTMTTTRDQLLTVLDDLATLLDQIGPDADSAATPCRDFDVAGLRRHVLGWLTAFTDGYASGDGQCSDPDTITVVGTGAAQVRAARDRLADVLPEAADRPLRIGESAMPGELACGMILWEYQVHGWDLARATGQAWRPADDGIAASLTFAPGMLSPDHRGEGKSFAAEVPVAPDAEPLHRLLGLSGRDPGWNPAGKDDESGKDGGHASGTFTVAAFDPQPHTPEVATGLPTGHVLMRKEFAGEIDGHAQTQFSFAFDDQTGIGTYVALESFTGTIDGRTGSCNIAHSATTTGDGGRDHEFLVIVPGSGTDQLAGISGTGSIVIDPDGTHHLNLDYRL